jgi:hypothetical protein
VQTLPALPASGPLGREAEPGGAADRRETLAANYRALLVGNPFQNAGSIGDRDLGTSLITRDQNLLTDLCPVEPQLDPVARGVEPDRQVLSFAARPGPAL